MPPKPLRVLVIAPLRFPIRRPDAGGLESAVWNEADQLRARGHEVTIIAAEGSDGTVPGHPFTMPSLTWPEGAGFRATMLARGDYDRHCQDGTLVE